ncbi:MAG TPA: hypothetical protein VGE41_11710 [Verrucomicrobiae bacterium]
MKSKLHLAGLLWALLAVGSHSAFGVDYTWTGNASGSWLDQNNWNPKGNPGAGDNVTINPGAGTYPTNAAGEVKDLTLGTCVPLGLAALIVHGNFNFNRGILQNGTLTIDGNGGTMNCNAGGACGNGNSLNNCIVVNNGTINATASGLLFNNATLNNAGTFNLGNQSLTPLNGINQLNNSGTFQTAAGTSAGVIGVSFDNSKSVIASSGELRFTGM